MREYVHMNRNDPISTCCMSHLMVDQNDTGNYQSRYENEHSYRFQKGTYVKFSSPGNDKSTDKKNLSRYQCQYQNTENMKHIFMNDTSA